MFKWLTNLFAPKHTPYPPPKMRQDWSRYEAMVLTTIVKQPERQHYVACKTLADVKRVAETLRGLNVGRVIEICGTPTLRDQYAYADALIKMRDGEAKVLVAVINYLMTGWGAPEGSSIHCIFKLKDTELMQLSGRTKRKPDWVRSETNYINGKLR